MVKFKDYITTYKGSDPLVIKLKDNNDKETKILASSAFWLNASNEMVNDLKNKYKNDIEINIKSLDE